MGRSSAWRWVWVIAAVTAAGGPSIALAADVRNEDDRAYTVRIKQDGGTLTFAVAPKSSLSGVGRGEVRVEVDGVGATTARDGQTVVIRNGKLSRR